VVVWAGVSGWMGEWGSGHGPRCKRGCGRGYEYGVVDEGKIPPTLGMALLASAENEWPIQSVWPPYGADCLD